MYSKIYTLFEVKNRKDEHDKYSQVYEVSYKGDQVFEWYDHVSQDSPEDLIWTREISEIFWAGVKAGFKAGRDETRGDTD